MQPLANGNRLGKEDRRRRDGEKRRVKANKRPRARVEDKTGARLGEGRRTEKDEGPLKNKNKRNRVEGECHCDRRGGLQRDARQKKKKIEGGKERQREKRKDESRNKKGKEDGDYAAREGEGRRSEKDKGAKGTEEENEKRLFTNVEEGKKRGKISAKRSGE